MAGIGSFESGAAADEFERFSLLDHRNKHHQ
jgi:hypothetical protein